MKYDLFYVSTGSVDQDDWLTFKSRFPNAQKIENALSIDDIKKKSFTKMFWIVWNDIMVRDDFKFEYEATKWDLEYVHVFKNGNHYNGVCLFPKSTTITSKEFRYRFFINKKEIDIHASDPKKQGSSFDIVFISYYEPNADENWNRLKTRFPRAKRIDKIKGIHQAHIEAAKLSTSEMFWVVDGDAQIVDGFNFDYGDPEKHTVHVWKSKNPINGLEYGYGGVKLLPTEMTLNMDINKPDMTTSISNQFKSMPELSNITLFNTDPFNTWKSAFRECCKLSSRVIDRQNDTETQQRLDAWCVLNESVTYGFYAYQGATQGKLYGETHKNNPEELKKINDFDWLKNKFEEIRVNING
jgi:hypothetical protein